MPGREQKRGERDRFRQRQRECQAHSATCKRKHAPNQHPAQGYLRPPASVQGLARGHIAWNSEFALVAKIHVDLQNATTRRHTPTGGGPLTHVVEAPLDLSELHHIVQKPPLGFQNVHLLLGIEVFPHPSTERGTCVAPKP